MKLNKDTLDLFLTAYMRDTDFYEKHKDRIQVQDLPYAYLQAAFKVVDSFYAEYFELPSKLEFKHALNSWLTEYGDPLDDDELENLKELTSFAYSKQGYPKDKDEKDIFCRFCSKVAERILLENLQERTLDELRVSPLSNSKHLSELLSKAAEKASVISSSAADYKPTLTFGDNWDKISSAKPISIGLPFFEEFMNGGTLPGEIYGFMAPYGTCKTTLAVMLWCESASRCFSRYNNYGAHANEMLNVEGKRGVSVLVSYEAPLSTELQHRALAYKATIRRDSLEAMGSHGIEALSKSIEVPKEYEKYEFKDAIADNMFIPEYDRAKSQIEILNDYTACFDFSGNDPNNPNAGSGGVAEIKEKLEKYLSYMTKEFETEFYVDTVIIDYLGAMIGRYREHSVGESAYSDAVFIQNSVAELKNKIAAAFNCHVWVLHQLTGQANSYSPTKQIKHTEAKGSSSYAENLDFAFQVGSLTNDSLGLLNCTKQRRAAKRPPTIIRVQGEFNRVVSASDKMLSNRGLIVDKDKYNDDGISDVSVEDGVHSDLMTLQDDELEAHNSAFS